MRKLALTGLLTASLAFVSLPTLADDYDHRLSFSSRHHHEHRDYRDDHRYRHDDKRYHDRRYLNSRRDYDRHRGWYKKKYHARHHRNYYRCGYHPGARIRHDHRHYYDSRSGEYLAIIGGAILLNEIFRHDR